MKNSKKSKKRSKDYVLPPSPSTHEATEEILKALSITPDAWDILLVGDGSGSDRYKAAGWGCVSVERKTGQQLVWTGCLNRGTVNFAEMMAYLQPLNWFAAQEADRRGKVGEIQAVRIHIVTDSDYCRTVGKKADRLVKRNAGLWAAFDAFSRLGFVLHWYWMERESSKLNRYCDQLSKAARKKMESQHEPDPDSDE